MVRYNQAIEGHHDQVIERVDDGSVQDLFAWESFEVFSNEDFAPDQKGDKI